MNIITSQPTQNTFTLPQLDKLESALYFMPQLSPKTDQIIKRLLKEILPPLSIEIFSSLSLKLKIIELREPLKNLERLRNNKTQDQCCAISRGFANTACLASGIATPVLGLGLSPYGSTCVTIASIIGYVVCGAYNLSSSNKPEFISPDSYKLLSSICLGPCFAGYETYYKIPLRITLAYNDSLEPAKELYSIFKKIIDASSFLRDSLQIEISHLENQKEGLMDIYLDEELIENELPSDVSPLTEEALTSIPPNPKPLRTPSPVPSLEEPLANEQALAQKSPHFIIIEKDRKTFQTNKNILNIINSMQSILGLQDPVIDFAAERQQNLLRIGDEIKEHEKALQELAHLSDYVTTKILPLQTAENAGQTLL